LEQLSPVTPLDIVIRVYGSTSTLTVGGELDFAVAEQLSFALHGVLADAPEMVVLDLSAVTFIDVAGVRAVHGACRHARAQSAYLTIIPGADRVQRVFRLTGLESTLPFAVGVQRIGRTEPLPAGPCLKRATRRARPRRDACLPRFAERSL
jgi:anti-sigma B factor antagonist